ncbi:MAG: hypothetical protein ABH983_00095 [Candidatus Micrarchaeota archaeon]
MPQTSWNVSDKIDFTTDHENFNGRKDYAENCAGGYYAARLAIAEKLQKLKRQGSVLALRFITGEYAIPLGVWVVREATRAALKQKPLVFEEKRLMMDYAKKLVKKRFNYDLDNLLRESVMLKEMKNQTKLSCYFL